MTMDASWRGRLVKLISLDLHARIVDYDGSGTMTVEVDGREIETPIEDVDLLLLGDRGDTKPDDALTGKRARGSADPEPEGDDK